jgi:phosphoglycerate dehydrogenase-like enzyme|tara:strand:+ start:4065 stop:4982 length:918 start_codon:yes stop_codon:yes gene_type:complete
MKIAVTSPSFSKHPVLIKKINEAFSDVKLNTEGKIFSQSELIEFISGYDATIVGLDEFNQEVIDSSPDLKIISKYGVGLNNIDLDYCEKKGIAIGWTGGVNRLSVAEMCLGNILSLIRNMGPSSSQLSRGEWKKHGGEQLTGKRIGIIGLGFIGKEMVRLLAPFYCDIWVNDIEYDQDYIAKNNLSIKTKEEIYKACKVISLHIPLVPETRELIGQNELAMMQNQTIILNSARGGMIDEIALFNELKTGRLAAALDVFEIEPPTNSEFLKLDNLIATPHIGGSAVEAIEAMGMSAIEHLEKFRTK